MGSRSTYRSSVPLSAAHGVTRPVVGQMFHVKHWLLCRWCSRRRRALLWGRGAVCAGGRWPAREPSVPRVVVGCALVFWAPEAPAAREIATREPAARSGRSRSPHVPSGPSGALHTRGAWALMCGSTRRLVVRPGPPPPTGTATGPSGSSGTLHTGGTWCAGLWPAVSRRRPPAPRPCSVWWACPFPPRAQVPSTVVGR